MQLSKVQSPIDYREVKRRSRTHEAFPVRVEGGPSSPDMAAQKHCGKASGKGILEGHFGEWRNDLEKPAHIRRARSSKPEASCRAPGRGRQPLPVYFVTKIPLLHSAPREIKHDQPSIEGKPVAKTSENPVESGPGTAPDVQRTTERLQKRAGG